MKFKEFLDLKCSDGGELGKIARWAVALRLRVPSPERLIQSMFEFRANRDLYRAFRLLENEWLKVHDHPKASGPKCRIDAPANDSDGVM